MDTQVQNHSPRHEAILQYIIANPTAQMQEVAQAFQVTPSWLSVIINSDVFQAELKRRQDQVFSTTVLPLREKLVSLAHTAVERLELELLDTQDSAFVLNTADKVLARLGYGPKTSGGPSPGPAVQNNYFTVDAGTLERARATRAGIVERPALPGAIDE